MRMKLRRHYHLLLLFAAAAVFGIVLRNERIVAYAGKGGTAISGTINYGNRVDLFDDSVVHELVVLISPEDQQKMVTTYQQTGNKDFFQADIIVDGVRINKVGIRLKGNASLRSAAGGGMRGGVRGMGGGNAAPQGGAQPPQDMQQGGGGRRQAPAGMQAPNAGQPPADMQAPNAGQPPAGMQPPAGLPAQGDFGRPGSGNASASLPYLVKLDKYVPGQRYQGLAEIALRTAGVSTDASLLQEPVSNSAMNSAGVPIARSAYASVQLADGEPKLYTIAEHPDQAYIDRLFPGSEGVLYKVIQVGNDFSYLGDDPTRYASVFAQETAVNRADMAPLIAFIRLVNEASDQEFLEQLPQRFDVTAFADYLAVMNLLMNNDSLAGMGNNYYLYYDSDTAKFTILAWDSNESLGKLAMGGASQMDIYWEGVGGQFGRGFGDAPGGRRGTHLLMKRFLATPEFRTLYKERYKLLYDRTYGQDLLAAKIKQLTALVTAYNAKHAIVDQTAFDAAASRVLNTVTQRDEYLKSTELLRR